MDAETDISGRSSSITASPAGGHDVSFEGHTPTLPSIPSTRTPDSTNSTSPPTCMPPIFIPAISSHHSNSYAAMESDPPTNLQPPLSTFTEKDVFSPPSRVQHSLSTMQSGAFRAVQRLKLLAAIRTEWVGTNMTWSKFKPVVRCAVVAWVLVVLFVLPAVQKYIGSVAYLVLIAPYLAPPSGPFLSVLEQQALIVIFVSLAGGWAALGSYLAWLARSVKISDPSLADVAAAKYLEPIPTLVIAVFIFFGTAFFLSVKAHKGFAYFAYIFSACLCLDISLISAVLYPYPIFKQIWCIILAFILNAVLSVLGSLLIFPYSISSQYTNRLRDILLPLTTALELHRQLLKTGSSPSHGFPNNGPKVSPDFSATAEAIQETVKKCEAGLVPLAASARLLKSDLIYSRFSPDDLHPFRDLTRGIIGRANGLGSYPALVDPANHHSHHPGSVKSGRATPVTSVFNVPTTAHSSSSGTPGVPKMQSPPGEGSEHHWNGEGSSEDCCASMKDNCETFSPPMSGQLTPSTSTPSSPAQRPPFGRSSSAGNIHQLYQHPHGHRSHRLGRGHHNHNKAQVHNLRHHHHILHQSLVSLAKSREKRREHAVGLFVNQRYLDLEAARLHDPRTQEYVAQATSLLQRSCDDALAACGRGLTGVTDWLANMRSDRFKWWLSKEETDRKRESTLKKYRELRDDLFNTFEVFRMRKRHIVLDPYRSAFDDPSTVEGGVELQIPPHRYLFNCYVYQYHLIQICELVIQTLDKIIEKEEERYAHRLWTPIHRVFKWEWRLMDSEGHDQDMDDDPDFIQGDEDDDEQFGFGKSNKRDPDALPPRNTFEWGMTLVYDCFTSLTRGNVLFAFKAGLFIVALSLPSLIKTSAPFTFKNRYVWAIFMGQMTLARFRGDTAFELVARILSTFFGCIVGLVMWYMSTGLGSGNPFGLAAVCAVCLPLFFFMRLYCPIPPIANIIFFLTTFTVIGYSYRDKYILALVSPGFGWAIGWKRFVFVTIGVVSAFFVSFLPPSTTIRRYQRNLLSTTSSLVATIYSSVISYANTKHEEDAPEIAKTLIALQTKLKRALTLRTNVIYEFSFRGRWPAWRYQHIIDLQLSIAYSLSHLISVVENLDPDWARAFLRRTRFTDPDFQGDIVAVISLISLCLRTGTPLPHITPCPLLDRFMLRYHGLNVSHKDKETEKDHGLPVPLSIETLQSEQYLMFCVGISTAFGLISRLDRLMLATKEIVGEQYHMHGVRSNYPASGATTRNGGVESGSRVNTVHFDPPRDV